MPKHGFILINEAKYGYDAVGNLLRLTLLRSPLYPDAEADRGHNPFRYALYPHGGTWKDAMAVQRGDEFNYGLIATQVAPHKGAMPAEHSFVSTRAQNVVITAMKKAEDSSALEFHLYEWKGTDGDIEVKVLAGASGAIETNRMETPQGGGLLLQITSSGCMYGRFRLWHSGSITCAHDVCAETVRSYGHPPVSVHLWGALVPGALTVCSA